MPQLGQRADVRGSRIRRLLSRALVVSGGIAAGCLLAAGAASAQEAETTNPLQTVAQAVSAHTNQVNHLVVSTERTAADRVRTAVADATSLMDQPAMPEIAANAGRSLNEAVQGVTEKLVEPSETVLGVVTKATNGLTDQVKDTTRNIVGYSAPAAATDERLAEQPAAPVRNDSAQHPVVAPSKPTSAPAAQPAAETSSPRQEPSSPKLPPLFPLPASSTIPGSCSCGHDGSGSTGFTFGGLLPAGSAFSHADAAAAISAAADCVLAGQAKQPGVTPD